MAIDASIYQGLRQPEYADPMKMYGNMLAIQNAGNQNALAQYQLSSAKRADADQESLRRLPAGATLQQQQDALRAIGKYKEAAELEKASLEGANTQAQINERKMIAAEKGLAMYGTMMGALASNPTPENFQATVQNVKNMGLGLHAPAPSDISQLTQWARSGAGMSKQGLDAIEAYKQKPTVMGGKIVQTNEFAPGYLGALGDVAPTAGDVMTDTRTRTIAADTNARLREQNATARAQVAATREGTIAQREIGNAATIRGEQDKAVKPLDDVQQNITRTKQLLATGTPASDIQIQQQLTDMFDNSRATNMLFSANKNFGTLAGRAAGLVGRAFTGQYTDSQRAEIRGMLDDMEKNVISPSRQRVEQHYKGIGSAAGVNPALIKTPNFYGDQAGGWKIEKVNP